MKHIYPLNAVDRLLRDSVWNNVRFGDNMFILEGEWRYILPVVIHLNKTLFLWNLNEEFFFLSNILTDQSGNWYANGSGGALLHEMWIIHQGILEIIHLRNSALSNNYDLRECSTDIPPEYLLHDSIVDDIYDSSEIGLDHLLERNILCPKNEDFLRFNEEFLWKVPGKVNSYFSTDTIFCDDDEEENNLQMDFINSLKPFGMPPHQLNL